MTRFVMLMMFCTVLCLSPQYSVSEIFKYVDANGKMHFTDAPPVGVDAKPLDIQPNIYEGSVHSKGSKTDQPSAAEIRKKKLLETKKYPKVELFVTSWCGYCKKAEAFLLKKGIPFTTYDIEKDLQAARRKDSLTSRKGVPFALIGNQKLTGFSEAYYERALQQDR